MTTAIIPNQTLDCRGMTYPVPILKAKRALDAMRAGEVLQVLATDKNTKPDLQVWAAKAQAELLNIQDAEDGSFSFFVQKK